MAIQAQVQRKVTVTKSVRPRTQRLAKWRRNLTRNHLVLVGTLIVVAMTLMAVLADVIAPYDPARMDATASLQGPSTAHWLGTDRFGRDILSRIIHGSRISLLVGVVSIAAAVVIGGSLGLISGVLGGKVDNIIGRIMDALFSFPPLLLAVVIAGTLGSGTSIAILAIVVVYAPLFSRVVRGSALSESSKEYVEAARVSGATSIRIIGAHIFPNVLSPLIVQASICLSYAILIEASLSYLGLGTAPPTPSWGTMLNEGRSFLEAAPWMSIFPGLAIVLAVLAFNLLGDGLRDLFDPRARSS